MAARTLFVCVLLSLLAFPSVSSAQTQTAVVWQPPVPIAWPEILFSISPGKQTWWPPVSDGDELSDRGHVVATSKDLLRNFHPVPTLDVAGSFVAVDCGLDALQEMSWGPVASAVPVTYFSLNQGFVDEKLGDISDGDLLASTGRIVARNKDLMAHFHPMPPLQDMGLDAAFIPYFLPTPLADSASPPEIWFSTNRGWYDEVLSRQISEGDLLSSRGYVVATNQQLLRNFQPVPVATDGSSSATTLPLSYGLDAAYVPFYRPWYGIAVTDAAFAGAGAVISPLPMEIWFSVRKGFKDARGFEVSDGDLLSTTGRVIRTNAQLLQKFPNPTMTPIQRNYGLDAIYVRCLKVIRTYPPMDATVDKTANNKIQLVFDGEVSLPVGSAVTVVSVANGQDVTSAFDVSLATTNTTNDTLVISERGSALADAAGYRVQPANALAVEPFVLDVGKLVGDVNGDGKVNVVDLLSLADTWAKTSANPTFDGASDLNNDGAVDVLDLLTLSRNWGR